MALASFLLFLQFQRCQFHHVPKIVQEFREQMNQRMSPFEIGGLMPYMYNYTKYKIYIHTHIDTYPFFVRLAICLSIHLSS